MPVQCSKGKGKSQALGPARVHSQKGLVAVVNLQRKEKVGKTSEAKNKPAQFVLQKVSHAGMIQFEQKN